MSYKSNYRKRVYTDRSESEKLQEQNRKHDEYENRKKKNRRQSTVENANLSNMIVTWDIDNHCEE